jgi:nitrogen-specific signal transduction histidine kinase
VLSITFNPLSSIAEIPAVNSEKVEPTSSEKAKADALLRRLQEIKAMDKSNLSTSEKRSLRKEVRTLKHEIKSADSGIYLSVAALIIIILLLILLL